MNPEPTRPPNELIYRCKSCAHVGPAKWVADDPSSKTRAIKNSIRVGARAGGLLGALMGAAINACIPEKEMTMKRFCTKCGASDLEFISDEN